MIPAQRPAFASSSAVPSSHVIGRIVCARSRPAQLLRATIVALALGYGLISLRVPLDYLRPENVYRKDILQEYVLARAVLEGADPYLPITALADRYLGVIPNAVLPARTPHPPPVALLFLPLSLLDYPAMAAVWLGIELICLITAVYLTGRTFGRRLPWLTVGGTATILLGWYPFTEDLLLGQLTLVLLTLIVGMQCALRAGRSSLAGTLLGVALVIKPVPWPLALLFLFRKDWRAFAAMGATLGAGYGAATWRIGLAPIVSYFTAILPAEGSQYRADLWNVSAWAIGWRLFDGAVLFEATAPPLIKAPLAAFLVSITIPCGVLLVACLALRKMRSIDAAIGLLVCVSILVSPVAWDHYLVLGLIPVAGLIGSLARRGFPVGETNRALMTGLFLALSANSVTILVLRFTGHWPLKEGAFTLPFAPTLLLLIPTVGIFLLFWMMLSQTGEPEKTSAAAGPEAFREIGRGGLVPRGR